ncbi:hypothetical protein V6N12_013499 [Hibiscus sabdariffa]|uniref:Uncharacterized protein n=1 Tax=Hibiscus sabdariffa TaxID=183260 RepID=A0ABR2C9K9_9ROSI
MHDFFSGVEASTTPHLCRWMILMIDVGSVETMLAQGGGISVLEIRRRISTDLKKQFTGVKQSHLDAINETKNNLLARSGDISTFFEK